MSENFLVDYQAEISECGLYRYTLWRIWDPEKPYCLFIMLNPSKADHRRNDPTIKKCMHYATAWGYGGLAVGNIFGFRASKPKEMMTAPDPVGPQNDEYLKKLIQGSGKTILAWGEKGTYLNRDKAVLPMIEHPYYLARTGGGHPGHPLFLAKNLKAIAYTKRIISFAWTTPQLLNGLKTVTRRDWSATYASLFRAGDLVQAYDKNPRVGGKRVAIIRLTKDPYKERLGDITDAEEKAEGGMWGSAREFIDAFCTGAGVTPDHKIWVIRFELISKEDSQLKLFGG